MTYFFDRVRMDRTSADTMIEVRATTHKEVIEGIRSLIERESGAGELVTWQDSHDAITPADAETALLVQDGRYLVGVVYLRASNVSIPHTGQR